MKKVCAIFFVSLVLLSSSNKAIVIVVHGTFASEEQWCRPGGDFYMELERQARYIKQRVIPFTWSGKLNDKSRLQAAEALAAIILSYCNEKIILIGHSHGGNIINLASKLLAQNKPEAPMAYLSELPEFMQTYRRIRRNRPKKEYLIDHVYLLATPIDRKNYAPDMKVIRFLCNFYSTGDKLLQKVFILYRQTLDLNDRLANLQVIIDDGMDKRNPSHSEMHDPIIAKSLLSLPHDLKELKKGGFDKFSWGKDGTVIFKPNGNPKYMADNKR